MTQEHRGLFFDIFLYVCCKYNGVIPSSGSKGPSMSLNPLIQLQLFISALKLLFCRLQYVDLHIFSGSVQGPL